MTLPSEPLVYLGNFLFCVDKAYRDGLHVITVDDQHEIHRLSDVFVSDLYRWCSENNCRFGWDRVLWDSYQQRWVSNGIGGGDHLFIVTDDPCTATSARLTWG